MSARLRRNSRRAGSSSISSFGGSMTRAVDGSAFCASCSKAATHSSSKANASGENTSSSPTTSFSERIGVARMDRIPSARQLSPSIRGSVSASSHRSKVPLRTHSPEKPDAASNRYPTGGALSPMLARHTSASSSRIAMTAPLPLVSNNARVATSCKAAFSLEFPKNTDFYRSRVPVPDCTHKN